MTIRIDLNSACKSFSREQSQERFKFIPCFQKNFRKGVYLISCFNPKERNLCMDMHAVKGHGCSSMGRGGDIFQTTLTLTLQAISTLTHSLF